MSRFLIGVAALAASCWLSASTALAENRIALVIGNSSYSTVTALPNPANDARAMTKFLASAGFQVVQEPDLTQSDMRRAISTFASMVAAKGPDTVALVFYAGHGLQVDGENYLIPIDARIEREADVPLQATRLGDVMNALSGVPSKSRIVIIDACRNNPFSAINKTGGRGLAIVNAPNGSLVSYSTAPGTEALDGDGENSPYTTALLKHGAEPGAPIEQVLKRVRQATSEATGRQQFPWESSSLISEFSFFPTASSQDRPAPTLAKAGPAGPASTLAKGGPASALAKAGPGSAALVSGSEARSVEHWRKELRSKNPREAYEIVVGEDRVEAYQAYLSLYPNQSLAPVVRTVLERRQVVVAWYQAVTINTPAAYQAFLASYGSSDYAVAADRLLQRALTRSAANAGAAFAATCPCTLPASPLPQRQKRSDPGNTSPSQNTPANLTSPTPTNVTGYSPPPAVYTDPAPPIVVAPPVYIPPPRPPVVVVPYPPRGCGKPYPPGDGKPYPPPGGDNKPPPPTGEGRPKPPEGGTKPPPTEGGHKPPVGGISKPPQSTGTSPEKPPVIYSKPQKTTSTYNPPITRRTPETPRVNLNRNVTPNTLRSSPSFAKPAMGRGMRGSPMGAMGMGRMGMGGGGGGMGKMMGGGGSGMGKMMGGGGGGMGRMMGGGGMGRMGGMGGGRR